MRPILLLLFLLIQIAASAQKEAQNWYFGERAGLSFGKGYAEALTEGMMLANEGCATMSDPETGQLLFYTNGIQVWNRQHQVMPNGSGLLSDLSSTQAALIVPFPGHAGQYFLFAINSVGPRDFSTRPGLSYSILNMELDGGLGDIEPSAKNIMLLPLTSEKLTAVPHANGKDYWVITHGLRNDEFYVFLLDEQGIAEPKTIKAGMVYRAGDEKFNPGDIAGYLKASPDGKKLASAVTSHGASVPIELFDFDAATGTISNAISLGVGEWPASIAHYGVSFSPDNSKLYISGVVVMQFDLSLPSVEEIINSQVQLTTAPSYGSLGGAQSLQLGPDGRLYNNVNRGEFNSFYVINYPNRAGMACEPELVEFDFKGGRISVGLPNFIQSYFNGLEPTAEDPTPCSLRVLQVYPNPTSGIVKFGWAGDCDFTKNFDLRIVNAVGQQVMALKEGISIEQEVDISSLAEGLYLFMLIFPGKGQMAKKVVKLN